MSPLHYSISPAIFDKFPGYIRGVVLANGLTNRPSPPELLDLLRSAEEGLRARLALDTLIDEPAIKAWREAFRSFGAKPSEFRPSIEALARRVLRSDPLPSINALVDIGNVVSLRHLLPAGAHAIDHLTQDISLRLADGSESFIPLGEEHVEHPLPGEVIFAEGSVVLTRRWAWRQSTHTLTVLESRAVEFNIDGLPPVTPQQVHAAGMETIELVQRFCGGSARFEVLTPSTPDMVLE